MRRFAALIWTVGIFVATLTPGTYIPETALDAYDKLTHVALFFGFAILWLALFPRRRIAVLLVGLAVGIGIEIMQSVLPIYRSGDPADALADAVGLALALGVRIWVDQRAGRATGPRPAS